VSCAKTAKPIESRLGCGLRWAKYTLAPPDEYDSTVHMRAAARFYVILHWPLVYLGVC